MPTATPASHGSGQAAGATTIGADGVLVTATATITDDPAPFRIDGLPEAGAFTMRDRIRAARTTTPVCWLVSSAGRCRTRT